MAFKIFNNLLNIYDFSGKYAAEQIALYLIMRSIKDDKPISNLQLQKILYYIQTCFLQKQKYALFKDEIEAWRFGPVVSNVYWKYCGFGAFDIYETEEPTISLSSDEKKIVDNILMEKRELEPWVLVRDTHKEGKAWSRIYQNGLGDKKVIPKEVILQYG